MGMRAGTLNRVFTPASSVMVFRAVVRAMLVVAPLGAIPLIGCTPPDIQRSDAFARDRVGALARSVDAALDSHREAEALLLAGLNEIEALPRDAGEIDNSYRRARTILYTADAGHDLARRRSQTVELRGSTAIQDWTRDLRDLDDRAMRAQSRERRDRVEEAYLALAEAMREADRSRVPVLGAIQDRVLLLKHDRDASGAGVNAELGGAIVPARSEALQRRIAELRAATQRVDDEGRRFRDVVGTR